MFNELKRTWRILTNQLYERYEHHGNIVWVRRDLKGKHREYCLCHSCGRFKPDTEENCVTANLIFAICKECDVVLPVWECPFFKCHSRA